MNVFSFAGQVTNRPSTTGWNQLGCYTQGVLDANKLFSDYRYNAAAAGSGAAAPTLCETKIAQASISGLTWMG
jgi:hypothetical protein